MQRKDILSNSDALIIGALTGATEVTVNLPLWTVKTRMQCDLPFTLKPSVLYRGYSLAVVSMVIITSIQLMNTAFVERSSKGAINTVSASERLTSSFLGGAFSSVLFCPMDLISTQYHKHNYPSYRVAALQTMQQMPFRRIYTGLPALAMVDGIFTTGFFGCYPFFNLYLQQYTSTIVAAAVAATITGVGSAICSSPFDAIKTAQQYRADAGQQTMAACVKELSQKPLSAGFFKGFWPRTIWLASAVAVAGVTADCIESTLQTFRKR